MKGRFCVIIMLRIFILKIIINPSFYTDLYAIFAYKVGYFATLRYSMLQSGYNDESVGYHLKVLSFNKDTSRYT